MNDALDDAEWAAERRHEVKKELAEALRAAGIENAPWQLENDVWVTGGLQEIMDFAQEWRSEIEEL